MIHFAKAVAVTPVSEITPVDDWSATARHSLLVVRDDNNQHIEFLEAICEFLNVDLEYATGHDDIGAVFARRRPIAVIARLEGKCQDGCHVMKTVALYDRTLPVLLLHGNDASLLGAVDAVREIWGLRQVTTADEAAGITPMADFIFDTARGAGMSGLTRV
jgi:hypothetical protein